MIMSYDEAKNYKVYANSLDELVSMCEDMLKALTPEERAQEHCFVLTGPRPTTKEDYFESAIKYLKNAVQKAKDQTERNRDYYDKYAIPKAMIDMEEIEYVTQHTQYMSYPPQMQKLIINTWNEFRYRRSPKLREEEQALERRLKQKREDIKKYTKPGESIGEAELAKRKARANPPKTSLSEAEIKRFDRMSEKWLVRWCNFSHNWAWVVPCLLLCIVANGGLVSAIGLITFMICGEIYSMRVQEYCGVILKWYVDADLVMEKRVINKYFKK